MTNMTITLRLTTENSIGCSDGYSLIKNAHDVECDNGKCDEKQCCEAVCLYYACPDYYTPVYGADTLLCDYSGCTTDKCCEKLKVSIKLNSEYVGYRLYLRFRTSR